MRWPAGLHAQAGQTRNTGQVPYAIPRPPVERYRSHIRAPIGNDGVRIGTVDSSGALTLQAGPSGLGNRWWPSMAVILTSSGANDSSTVQFSAGPLVTNATPIATSYSGGGDNIGLPQVELQPGEFIFAVWSGGNSGDTATLRVIGEQYALS